MLAISESAYIKDIKEFIKDPCEDGRLFYLWTTEQGRALDTDSLRTYKYMYKYIRCICMA